MSTVYTAPVRKWYNLSMKEKKIAAKKKSVKCFVGKLTGGIYPYECLVFIGATKDQIMRKMKQYQMNEEKEKFLDEMELYGGKATMFSDNTMFMWVFDDDIPTIAHELFHITEFIMTRSGQKLTDDSDEGWAYLNAHLWSQIIPLVEKYKKYEQIRK